MNHDLLSKPYPLDRDWARLRPRLSPAPSPEPPVHETYMDIAERLARVASEWQNRYGAIIDPYARLEASTVTPRFVGTLGQVIGAGRCSDLRDTCVRSYENCLGRMSFPWNSPEFAIKEMVLAHRALAPLVSASRRAAWEAHWRDYDAEAAFNCCYRNMRNNFNTFGLCGEYLRIREGLGGDMRLVDRLIERELENVDEYGMYHDPGCPMTYHVVVMQQWALILASGYDGRYAPEVGLAVRRGGLTSLLMQSATGQAPFGGRSNQFHHMEAQSAALFEACAVLALQDDDPPLAGAFRRAARRGVEMVRPWIMDMEPLRHLKQGFHPDLNHGTDSSGLYSVYGLLAGSLCCIADSVADHRISECLTPAELGGYAFTVDPGFHKVFACAGGWSVEIDTQAQMGKDATGLGRVQHISLRPEAILSGSIPADPEYSCAFHLPQRNAAIGPEWDHGDGTHRLADYSLEISSRRLQVTRQDQDRVDLELVYEGEMGEVRQVAEHYSLDASGLDYSAHLDPPPAHSRYIIPVIATDGEQESQVSASDSALCVRYRGQEHVIRAEGLPVRLTDEENSNRNATYGVATVEGGPASDRHLHIGLA